MQRWSRGILGGGVLLVVAAAGIWLVNVAGSAAGEGGTLLSVSPASQNVAVGADHFGVDIVVANVQNLGAYEFTLRFDPAIVEYIGASEKGFLKTTGRTQSCQPTTPIDQANERGGVTMGCTTRDQQRSPTGGPMGPNGSALLATVGFRPRSAGTSDLFFDGLEAGPQPTAETGQPTPVPEVGKTGLATVDFCDAGCDSDAVDIAFSVQTGIVAVFDPNAGPTPSAVPATPTLTVPKPRGDQRKTVQAILGTPERRVNDGTPIPGAPDSAGGSSNGGRGSAGGASGSVAGANNGGGRTGDIAPGAPGAAGSAGGSRSATGAPRAGFGPDPQPGSPWPGRASLVLALAGMGAIIAGVAGNRRAQRA
jgi:hypothetical protein